MGCPAVPVALVEWPCCLAAWLGPPPGLPLLVLLVRLPGFLGVLESLCSGTGRRKAGRRLAFHPWRQR